ncbi:TetR/AcrR family transcriptional regulator [Mycolicibacterium lutetiense]|uniref:AcrR family transcriptional regulator n=1 Tax=Mycolicibacterium lutetiense TaxID=1641992 RepID=A0ABS4ZLP4_9MYCO|nr:TetR/AcrR family transcriptional regulator [Mycolicibacterium lutetiense]MBP2450417.1 AcrR family transcriptional regulator [Mycolicibacterium lutetiense]
MSIGVVDDTAWPEPTRRRMLDAAMKLFSQYSFAGTSLQMIAAELNLTKAAIYYHFRTREQLLIALMQPMLSQIGQVVERAERSRGDRARAEAILVGYADIVARNRSLTAVTVFDPSVSSVLRNQPEWAALIERQLALLAAVGSSPTGAINAAAVMTGLAGAASTADPDLADDALREELVAVGRRILELPAPKR